MATPSSIGIGATLVLASLASAACSRQKQTDAATVDAGAPSVSASASASSATPPGAAPAPYGLALADRLAREAVGRPSDTPKADDVLAAVAKGGVPLVDQAQHLASPIGARFCIGAKSPANVSMSACEYADAAAAAAGRDLSLKSFAKVEHRDVFVNKKTTLTILQSPFDAKSQAAHDKAVATFKAL